MNQLLTSGSLILIANIITILVSFRRPWQENLRMICACAGIMGGILFCTARFGESAGLFRLIPAGVWFLPSLYFIHSGSFAQKIFVTCTVLSVTYMMYIGASFGAMALAGSGGEGFEFLRLFILAAVLLAYVLIMIPFGSQFLEKVFSAAGQRIWGLYVFYPALNFILLRRLYDYSLVPPEDAFARALFYSLLLFAEMQGRFAAIQNDVVYCENPVIGALLSHHGRLFKDADTELSIFAQIPQISPLIITSFAWLSATC